MLVLMPLLSPERDVPTPVERVQIANTKATLLSALTVASGEVAARSGRGRRRKNYVDRAEQLLADKAGSKT